MKGILKSLLIACIVPVMSGCGDWLDYNEVTEYTKDQTFSDFQRVNNYVTNIYSRLENGLEGYNNGATLASACDEAECAWPASNVHNFYNGAWGPLRTLTSTWADSYWGIRSANFFLENWEQYTFEDFKYNLDYVEQMERYRRYQYEVRFLRAYFYFELVKTFGDVPLVLETMTAEEANQAERTSKQEIFRFIADECDAIADELPLDYAALPYAETGRITRLAVLALKARSQMYAASPLFRESGADAKALWKQAALANKKVLEACAANGVALDNYANLTGVNNFKGKEVIYARRLGNINTFETNNFPVGVEGGNSGNCPTQTLVDAYRMQKTGKLWNEEGSGYDPENPYAGRDPRMALTVVTNGTTKWPNWNTSPIETFEGGLNGHPLTGATPTGYYLRKYCDPAIDLRPGQINTLRHSWIMYRLSEFYLNYAECVANYLGNPGMTDEDFPVSAVAKLNELKTFRNMPVVPTTVALDEFMEYYRNERMVELAFEGHRFWDVRRWKLGEVLKSVELMKLTKREGRINYERVTRQRAWDDKMYLFPIADEELRKNTKLTQNPGWK